MLFLRHFVSAESRFRAHNSISSTITTTPARIGTTALSMARESEFPAPPDPVQVRPATWTVVATDDHADAEIAGLSVGAASSYTEVRQAFERHLRQNPSARDTLAMAPNVEVGAP